jgi:hypothetical protein
LVKIKTHKLLNKMSEKEKLKGRIIVGKEDLDVFKGVCEDRFAGTYEIAEELKYSYYVDLEFGDIQDIFSLGQIFEQDNILKHNIVTSK